MYQIEQKAVMVMYKLLQREAIPLEELEFLKEWVNASPQNKEAFEYLMNESRLSEEVKEMMATDEYAALLRCWQHIAQEKRAKRLAYWGIAVFATITILAAYILYALFHQ